MEYSATIFAQELTRIELEHLCFLGPEELVHAFAKDMKSSSQNLPTDEVETEAQVIIPILSKILQNLPYFWI